MHGLFEALCGSGENRIIRKKVTIVAVYVTLALILGAIIAFGISSRTAKSGNEDDKKNDSNETAYVALSLTSNKIKSGDLILVNKNNAISFEENSELVSLVTNKNYGLKDGSLEANPEALAAFDSMMADLNVNVEKPDVVVMTAYRTKEFQDSLNNGTPGGCSDFHTGMSFELKDGSTYDDSYDNLNKTDKYAWLYANAHKYGFVVRYPDDTDTKSFSAITGVSDYGYVFRYVGIAHATYMYEKNLCLEEYLELLRTSYKYGNSLKIGKNYEVYYVESTGGTTEVKVPTNFEYEISGDNMNGYIVTVFKSKSVKQTSK